MWTRNQKLRGIREKQPGAKGLLKKQIMIFFSKIHCKILSQTFINKEKQVLLCMGLRSNLIRIGLVYIFLTLLEKNLKIQPQLLLRSKSCKTRYILYLGGRWSGFSMSTWTRGRQCTKCPRKSTIGRQVVKNWSMQFLNDPKMKLPKYVMSRALKDQLEVFPSNRKTPIVILNNKTADFTH